jgi:hypothetical protein
MKMMKATVPTEAVGCIIDGGQEAIMEILVEMRQFQVFTYPEEPELAPSWAAGVARDGKTERKGSNGGGWVYNR